MFKIKIHPTIEEIVRWLYKLKVWQNGEKSDTPETNKKLLYLMFYFTFFLHNIMCAIQAKDENETFFLMVAGVIIAVTEVRVIHVVGKNKEILGFLYHPLDDDSNEFLQETTSSGRTMNNFMKFVHAYIAAMFVAVILLLIFPMLSATKTLPLFVTYSYDGMFSDIFYYLLYLYVSSELVLSLIFNVTNVLNWYIMLNYSISYEKLGERLKRLGDRKEEPEDSQEATSHCPYFEDLISSTLAHQNIFRYYFKYITGIVAIQANVILFPSSANEFVSVSSNLFMVQMATSSISICLSVYNLAHVSKTWNRMSCYIKLIKKLYSEFTWRSCS